jgi:uncharacterized protein YbjT (DUF2867 family)
METSRDKGARLSIVGATGMVGGCALRYALDHAGVAMVTAIGRRSVGFSHPKLKEVLHQDFADCTPLGDALAGQDGALFCLGAYTGAVSNHDLRRVTVDYALAFAEVLRRASPGSSLSFLSGAGADPTGRSRMAFARYKGEAENAMLNAAFSRVFIFRPAYIYPVEARREPTLSYRLMRSVYPLFRRVMPNQVVRSDVLGRAMVDVILDEALMSPTITFENRDILALGNLHPPARA